jgi:alpha-N-arabinofuranosidase
MILTPTYHVFEMYTVHHDATLLPTDLDSPAYSLGKEQIPALHVSASQDRAKKIHLSLCNLNPDQPVELPVELRGAKAQRLAGRVLTAPQITAHNTFDKPDTVRPADFAGYKLTEQGFAVTVPPKSVVVLAVE